MNNIAPQPIPVLWGFDVTEDGEQCIMVAQHFLGTSVFHISYENVESVAQALLQQKARLDEIRATNGKGSQEKLMLPAKVVLGPDGQPMKVVPPGPEVQDQEAKLKSVPPPDDEDAGRRGD